MAVLLTSLACSGSALDNGSPNASGSVRAFMPGTSVPTTIWADAAESAPLAQPVQLDAAGRARIYTAAPVDLQTYDAAGALVSTLSLAASARAEAVEVANGSWTGTTSTGTLAAGGKTSLDAVLSSLGASIGGLDGLYRESAGATGVPLQTVIRDIAVSVRSFGAKGDGSADDTSAIQTTINEVKRLGGGVVYFPPGTYMISSAISVTNGNGIYLKGAGPFSSIIKQSNATVDGIDFSGGTGCSIDGIELTHSSITTGAAVSVSGSAQQFSAINLFVPTGKFRFAVSANSVVSAKIRSSILGGAGAVADAASRAISANTVNGLEISSCSLTNVGGTVVDVNAVINYNVAFNSFSSDVAGVLITNCDEGSIVANTGLSNFGTAYSFAGANTRFRQSSNGTDSTTVIVTSGGSVTPNPFLAPIWKIRATTTGSAYTVNVPSNAPSANGYQMTLHFFNNAGSAVTGWTLGAGYHTTGAIPVTDGHHIIVVFEYDVDSTIWRETSRADTT